MLPTGHTGFKGSWQALWFLELRAQVTGLALAPDTDLSLFDQLELERGALSIASATSAMPPCSVSWWLIPP